MPSKFNSEQYMQLLFNDAATGNFGLWQYWDEWKINVSFRSHKEENGRKSLYMGIEKDAEWVGKAYHAQQNQVGNIFMIVEERLYFRRQEIYQRCLGDLLAWFRFCSLCSVCFFITRLHIMKQNMHIALFNYHWVTYLWTLSSEVINFTHEMVEITQFY